MSPSWVVALHSLLFVCVSSFGLYADDGRISILTAANFSDFVHTHPTLVQFYLRTCGSCQNYAPQFKTFSKSIEGWKWAVKLAVIDCVDSQNDPIRDYYNVTVFPTFLFFSRSNKTIPVKHSYDNDAFRKSVAEILVGENLYKELPLSMNTSNTLTIYGPDNIEVIMLILDFQLKSLVALQSDFTEGLQFGVRDKAGNILFSNESAGALRTFLLNNYVISGNSSFTTTTKIPPANSTKHVDTITYSMPVYAADIISSLQILLARDIGMKDVIKGVELDALKEFLTVLSKYLDLGRQYNEEIAYLKTTVDAKTEISRREWVGLVALLNLSTDRVKFIACRGTNSSLRGYPCGLWVMFHSMTVSRFIQGGGSDEPAPIAHALNRFVPHFFSCSYCAYHFARMTSNVRLETESVYPDRPGVEPPFLLVVPDPATLPPAPKSAREEVLWLNTAHNMVNKRLAGQPSEDPAAPKQIFPSPEQCRACWSESTRQQLATDKFAAMPDNREELLAYLVHHYRPSSWRWDGVFVSFEDISRISTGTDAFNTTDMVLVGVICVGCATSLAVLFALICCRWRRSLCGHTALSTIA